MPSPYCNGYCLNQATQSDGLCMQAEVLHFLVKGRLILEACQLSWCVVRKGYLICPGFI